MGGNRVDRDFFHLQLLITITALVIVALILLGNCSVNSIINYSLSGVKSGGGITYTGTPDDYTVGAGYGVINSRALHFSGHGTKAETLLTIPSYSITNGCIVKDGSTYYQFYSRWRGADIYYATSTDLINWTEQGVVLDHTVWKLAFWTVSVIKIGSTWYLTTLTPESGMVYFTSSSVASGYSFADQLKDNTSTAISFPSDGSSYYLDPHIFYDSATELYTISVAWIKSDNSERTIRFFQTSAPLSNQWTLVNSDAIHYDYTWETGAIEAPYLVKGTDNNYYLFYSGGDSSDRQRVGVASAGALTDPFTKLGIDGMVLLDVPLSANGPMVAPRLLHESGTWYLYVASNKSDLMGYYCTDTNFPLIWKPLKTSSQLYASATNTVYVNPAGDIMHGVVALEGQYLTVPNHTAYFKLGSLVVDGSRQVTGYTDLRDILTNLAVVPVSEASPLPMRPRFNMG
jgi:Glycosyl hydrolases family 43